MGFMISRAWILTSYRKEMGSRSHTGSCRHQKWYDPLTGGVSCKW